MFILFIILFFVANVSADVYVITKPDNSVYSVSPESDAVVPDGYEEHLISNKNVEDYSLNPDVSLYNFSGNNFSLDSKRVKAKQKKEADEAAKLQEMIDARASALDKLEALGLTKDELKSLFN